MTRFFEWVFRFALKLILRFLSYRSLDQLVRRMDEPHRSTCLRMMRDHRKLFETVAGSTHNHQTWRGGYADHVTEVMNIAVVLYFVLHALRRLPFSLADALLVLFLHDIEKPWRFRLVDGALQTIPELATKEARKEFRERKLAECGIVLTEAQHNALTYVEGEHKDYSPFRRVSNEMAAFCHLCDTTSARIWYNHPLLEHDPWQGAKRTRTI